MSRCNVGAMAEEIAEEIDRAKFSAWMVMPSGGIFRQYWSAEFVHALARLFRRVLHYTVKAGRYGKGRRELSVNSNSRRSSQSK